MTNNAGVNIVGTRSLLLAATAAAAFATNPASAQQTNALQGDAKPGQSVADESLGDIVVTGEKRDRLLQKTPLAISAITADKLEQNNLFNPQDLTGFAPSLVVQKEDGFDRTITIRGLGKSTAQAGGISPAVAFHQDGIFFPSSVSINVGFFDVDRIEVLRGPQGTVFGQNAIGGVINIITNQPKLGERSGALELAGGNYDLFQVKGAVNVPLADTLALRVTGQYFRHNGYTTNIVTGQDLDEEDGKALRVQLLWQPAERFKLTGRFQLYDTAVNGPAQKSIFDPTPDPRKVQQNFPSYFQLNNKVFSIDAQYTAPTFTAKLIGSYQYERSHVQQDTDRGVSSFTNFLNPGDTLGVTNGLITDDRTYIQDAKRNIYTAEINVLSTTNSWLDWIVGAFYLREDRTGNFLELGDGVNGPRDGIVDPPQTLDRSNPFGNVDLNFANFNTYKDTEWSIYGQGTVHLSSKLRFTGGVRYLNSRNVTDSISFFLFESVPVSKNSFFTGKAGIEYDVTPETLLYATYTRGGSPGGGSLTNGTFVKGVFDGQRVNAFEAGAKARFLDNRLQFNLAGYYYDLRNYAILGADAAPFAGGVVSIPKARNYGIEIESSALITPRLRLDFTGSYQSSRITSHFLALDNALATIAQANAFQAGLTNPFTPQVAAARASAAQDLFGNQLPRAPEWTLNSTLSYRFDLGSVKGFIGTLNYNWTDAYWARAFQNPQRDRVRAYGLLNASLGWRGGPWSAQVAVSNLLNKNFVNQSFTDAFGVSATYVSYVPPRVVRVSAGVRF